MSAVDDLRFVFLLAKKGTLLGPSVDHEHLRRQSLREVPQEIFDPESFTQKSNYETFRSGLLAIPVIRSLVGNTAFLKSPDNAYRQFFISHQQRLVYLRIYKCGSTSVLKSFLPYVHEPLRGYALKAAQVDSLAHYLVSRSLPGAASKYTCFTVTRNPLERLVSAYLDVFNDPAYRADFLFGVFRKSQTFKEVVKLLALVPDKYRGPHFVSQSRILTQAKGARPLVFNLGSNNVALRTFLQQHGMQLAFENKSPVIYDHTEYYDPETLELAYRIYEQDFNTLGYASDFHNLKKIIGNGWNDKNHAPHSSEAASRSSS
ncbi:MAG TPA: sulfotransferase family 2 domain-containing protein [Cyclobacteriaceae bacterium]